MELRERWIRFAPRLGISDPEEIFRQIADTYSDDPGNYHTLRHVAHCLEEFDQVRPLALRPDAVELAIWFHDAIYDPKAHDNEEQSANLLRSLMTSNETEEAARLILATKHQTLPDDADTKLITDIDLVILGKPEEEFDEYERQIRHEYAWVPNKAFREGRAKVLRMFLNRASIYSTAAFRDRYESQAKENLQRSLSRLI